MSLDPIGTPRRDASFSSSLNCLGNGYGVTGGGSSRFFNNGTPVSQQTSATMDSHTADIYARFDQLKHNETQKNKLIEELLARYQYLQEEYSDLEKALSAARLTADSTDELDHYKTAYNQCISMVVSAVTWFRSSLDCNH